MLLQLEDVNLESKFHTPIVSKEQGPGGVNQARWNKVDLDLPSVRLNLKRSKTK